MNDALTHKIIGAAYEVHNTLGAGFLEKVYENALCLELKKHNLEIKQQFPIEVTYKENLVGEFYADILVENRVIVELKAVSKILPIHEVQLVNYLNATKIPIGLLINFGVSVGVKRKFPSLD